MVSCAIVSVSWFRALPVSSLDWVDEDVSVAGVVASASQTFLYVVAVASEDTNVSVGSAPYIKLMYVRLYCALAALDKSDTTKSFSMAAARKENVAITVMLQHQKNLTKAGRDDANLFHCSIHCRIPSRQLPR